MRKWFFQANPKMYDIDAALESLDTIWWRVPQYTAEIHLGDVVALWRSGKEAGIAGVGRVAGEPRQHATPDAERAFVQVPDVAGVETRVPLRVARTPFIPKDQVRRLAGFEEHPMIKAPMGTVIAISDQEFEVLSPLLSEPPDLEDVRPTFDIPAPFAWEQRAKAVQPMPGGYDAYLESLRLLLDRVLEERPTRAEFAELVGSHFDVSDNRSNALVAFLYRAGFLVDRGEVVAPTDWSERWLETGDHRIAVGLLHSRVTFIGELLRATLTPRTTSEVLDIANGAYGCGWSTKAQIDRRRGWLQSAGMVEVDESNRLATTAAGKAVLEDLLLHEPTTIATEHGAPQVESAEEAAAKPVELPSGVSRLVKELRESSTLSSNPDRFERAVRDVFLWLGFQAEWLGGSGKTDVLLDAPLGKGRSYRVILDCKTSGSGSVGDQQIDWITLAEHRTKHDADFVAVVAPSPSGQRLFERASEQKVTVIPVDELATLCEQHGQAPLDLESYRSLFKSGGLISTDTTAEQAEDWLHVVGLAQRIIQTIEARSEKFGPLDAGGLQLLLADDPAAEAASLQDFQDILDTLAGPLMRILTGTAAEGYRLTTPASVAHYRMELLGHLLFDELTSRPIPPRGASSVTTYRRHTHE